MKPSVFELDALFRSDRPNMVEHNRSSLVSLFDRMVEEVEEAREELPLANEGNVEAKMALSYEMADVILFCCELIRACGEDPELIIRDKIGRNNNKYPSRYFTNGLNAETAIKRSKEEWIKWEKLGLGLGGIR